MGKEALREGFRGEKGSPFDCDLRGNFKDLHGV